MRKSFTFFRPDVMLLAKSRVEGYTKTDGTYVEGYDNKKTAAAPKQSKAAHTKQVESIAKKHAETLEHNSQGDWEHDGKHGKIPASDVAGLPEHHQKEVYGHTGKISPQSDNFSPEFQKKGHAGFVLKHTNGKKSFVQTEGYGYARYHAPVDDDAGDSGSGGGKINPEPHPKGHKPGATLMAKHPETGKNVKVTYKGTRDGKSVVEHQGKEMDVDHAAVKKIPGTGSADPANAAASGQYLRDEQAKAKSDGPAAGGPGDLPDHHGALMEDGLNNDENSTDEELEQNFIDNGVHPDHAKAAIKHRDMFRMGVMKPGALKTLMGGGKGEEIKPKGKAAAAPAADYDHPNVVGQIDKHVGIKGGAMADDHGDVKDAASVHFAGKEYNSLSRSGASMHDETSVHAFEHEDGERIWVDDKKRVHADSTSEVKSLRERHEAHKGKK